MANREYDQLMNQLDKVRVQKGMSITAWADLAGLPRPTVYRALTSNPKRSVGLDAVNRLADVLGMRLTIEQKPSPRD